IFLFLSDNGASREGQDLGTTAYFRHTQDSGAGQDEDWLAYERDLIGGPRTWPHYPRGWGMACNTPFRLYKASTYRAGHQVPMVMSWPRGLGQPSGTPLRRQYTHVTDVVPTILELVGVDAPAERHGRQSEPLDGSSFVPTIRDGTAAATHGDQYQECNGNRGFRRGKWEAVTNREPEGPFRSGPERTGLTPLSQDKWELFDSEKDPTQCVDVAEQYPEVVEELKQAWDDAAWRNRVFPINEGVGLAHLRRPSEDESLSRPVTILPGTPTLERYRSSRLIDQRSFTVELTCTVTGGDQGVLFAHGGQEGGYVLYVEGGRLHFEQNAFGRMIGLPAVEIPQGEHEIAVEVLNSGNGVWDVTLRLDGVAAANGDGFLAISGWLPFQGLDVGRNRRSPVSWDVYERHGAFPFTGTLGWVRWVPGEEVPNAREKRIAKAIEMGMALE
ncbi:sulfatase-like hydrolase/transferase, partial [Dietzia lutea]